MRKIILLLGSLIAIIGIIVGLYLWNKPHKSIEDETTQLVTAIEVSKAFEVNEAQANQQFLNKALTVAGVVQEVGKNQDNAQLVLLKGSDELSGVQCTMKIPQESIKVGDSVLISGFCNGYTVVVLLNDCVVINKKE